MATHDESAERQERWVSNGQGAIGCSVFFFFSLFLSSVVNFFSFLR